MKYEFVKVQWVPVPDGDKNPVLTFVELAEEVQSQSY
jgi:hypothetical protein